MTRIEAIKEFLKEPTFQLNAAYAHEILRAWDTRETALRALVEQLRADAAALGAFIARYTEEEAWEDEAAARADRRAREECAEALYRLLEQEP